MIREILERTRSLKENKENKYKIYVSEVGKCDRAIFLRIRKISAFRVNRKKEMILEAGKQTHERILRRLYEAGVIVAAEIPIPEHDVFTGRADSILADNGVNYLLEIKSVNSDFFQQDKIPLNHYWQIQLYLYFLNLDKAILLLENKDNQDLKEFVISKDQKVIDLILERYSKLLTQIRKGEIPDTCKNPNCEVCR